MSPDPKAMGRADSPFLFIMLYRPSEGMEAWFWRQVALCGIKKSECRVIFMINDPPANTGNKPSKAQLLEARDRFELELKRSKPKVVIPMGTEAFHEVTGINESILDARGYLIRKHHFHKLPRSVIKQIGTYAGNSKATGAKKGDPKMGKVTEAHESLLGKNFSGTVIPAFTIDYIRGEKFNVTAALLEDLRRARRACDGTLCELVLTDIIGTVKKCGSQKSWGDLVAIDIETHGIDNEVIDLVSFSDGVKTAVLDWDEDARRFLDKMFANKKRRWAVHNSPFDIPRLRKNGVVIPQEVIDRRLIDTMFGAVVVQPALHKALGRVATVYLDIEPWKTSSRNEKSHWRAMVNADPKVYAGKDAFHTYYIAVQLEAVMKDLGMWNLFMGVGGHPGPGVMETIPELALMTEGGIRVDKGIAQKFCEQREKRQFRYLKLWKKMFPDIIFSKNNQLSKLFYNTWGLPVYRNKEDGVPVDELTLVKLQAFVKEHADDEQVTAPWREDPRCNHRTFDLMLRMRANDKLLSTYIRPALFSTEEVLHPSYLPASKDEEKGKRKNGKDEMPSKGATDTGRLASYNPNIQNQPKKMRKLYVPDRDEMCFVQWDFSAAELWSLGGYSGDEVLMADLRRPKPNDIHQRNGDRLGITRDTGKNVIYASQYLATPSKQSEMILEQNHMWVSPADCLHISTGIWANYVNASAYRELLIEMSNSRGYVQNKFGRIRFLHSGQATQAVNFIPQSTVADIIWCVLKEVAVFLRSLGGRLVTTVHDSFLGCVPADKVEEAAIGVKRIMEKPFDCVRKGWCVPVEVEIGEAGASWGDLKKYAL